MVKKGVERLEGRDTSRATNEEKIVAVVVKQAFLYFFDLFIEKTL